MVDPTTTNRGYAVPTHGSDVDTWDQPLNTNFGLLDNNLGGLVTIALSNANVTLASNQYQCGTIRFVGTLTSDVQVFFPAVSGWWIIDNQVTPNGSNFNLGITGSGGQLLATPPGVATDIYLDGTNVKFRNLGKVGEYWDYSGSSYPRWLNFCSVPPYLLCDGSSFSGTTYPYLANILGGTTLPDLRGGTRATLNQGTSRITTAGSGINGDALLSRGGSQLAQSHNHTYSGTTGGMDGNNPHNHPIIGLPAGNVVSAAFPGTGNTAQSGGNSYGNATIGVGSTDINHGHPYSGTTSAFGSGGSQNMPPTTIGGITMIRAA